MKVTPSVILKVISSILIGLMFSSIFAFQYFGDGTYTSLDKCFLVAVPAFALACVVYFLIPHVQRKWIQISFSSRLTIMTIASLAAVIYSISFHLSPDVLSVAKTVSFAFVFSVLMLPAGIFLQKTIEVDGHFHLFLSWLFGSVAAFFVTSFLSNFYTEFFTVFLLTASSLFIFGVFSYYIVGRIKYRLQKDGDPFWITSSLFVLLLIFQVMIFRMGMQFPKLFNLNYFLLQGRELIMFVIVSIIFLPWLAWAVESLKEPVLYHTILQNKIINFVRKNLSGLLFSALFFCLYFLIGTVLNHPRFDVDDIFFDADGFIWRFRLTTDQWQDFYWRSVHPLALLILRPSVALLSSFLKGDRYFAVIILAAAAGATCVFLVWMFMMDAAHNSVSALIVAFLLGISASHLIFGSLVETYIFLAAAILFFFVLMQKGNRSLPALVSLGAVTMGITLTNFIQTVIALLSAKPSIKYIVNYIMIVVALAVSLTLVSNLFYPNASPYFFVPSSFLAEEQNVRAVSFNRAQALIRAFLFNNIVAPSPLLSHKDIPFTQFRFYRAEDYQISRYSTPLQLTTGLAWLGLLVVAAIYFIKDFKSQNTRLTFSLLGCVLFNLLIHLRYGKELFLYSPNWTYAIVLLLGISWRHLFEYKWFQILMIIFLLLLMLNNAALLYTIMETSAPYIK